MSERIHYTHCPICNSPEWKEIFRVKDHTVSGELFPIVACSSCTLRFTQDIPAPSAIGAYYQSDNYISHSDTAKGFVNRLYHIIRKRTITRKRKLVQQYTGLEKGRILDVGSGTGAFINGMKEQGWEITGLEPDAGARSIAREQYGIELSDIDRFYQLPAGSFDAITMWHVLEHVHDLPAYIRQLKALLAPGGKLIIAVPNYTSFDAGIYQEHWAAYDVPRHLYHFSPRSMEVLMEKNALHIAHYKPLWYDSFYISLLSSKYKNGKTNWLAAAWNGLRSNLVTLGNVKRCSSVIYIIEKRELTMDNGQ